jgi:HlyD family secretion protein
VQEPAEQVKHPEHRGETELGPAETRESEAAVDSGPYADGNGEGDSTRHPGEQHLETATPARSQPAEIVRVPAARPRPIPTPAPVRWQRAQLQLLPVLTFLLCSVVAWRLWQTQGLTAPTVVGEVNPYRAEVASPRGGVLARIAGRQLRLYDSVAAGEVVARVSKAKGTTPGAGAGAKGGSGSAAADAAESEDADETDNSDGAVVPVTAPIGGQVIGVYARPGHPVQPGEPILTIAAAYGSSVTTYVRPGQRIQPEPRMSADVRLRSDPSKVYRGVIERVGAEVEPIPVKQLRDQKVKEWGLPVIITLPPEATPHPGELVDVNLRPNPAGK